MFGITLIVYWWLLLAGIIFNAILGLCLFTKLRRN